ncbi:MAG: class I SAM-dependent methyltransferase [Patescibacteria group bacterium]|nr:class I SAM-dependent methyltransferase [Patescibacteria group bacterium]
MKKLGKFGALVKQYERARRQYPPEVFIFLKSKLAIQKPAILDLGCGTGISTRQLARLGAVIIGCDPDYPMLVAAKKHQKIGPEKYVLGAAEKLPFKNSTFDVVTAFGAFHWFDDRKSIAEIKRVLKPSGIIFIVNKNGLKSWSEGYRQAIIKTIGQKIANFQKNTYDPKRSLEKNGFKKIQVRRWPEAELYTLDSVLEFIQSVSIWNSVPPPLRTKALAGLKIYFKKMKQSKGKIERKLAITVVTGIK